MNTGLIIYLLFIHWIADFVLQTDRMAKEKSSNNLMLFYHCFMYAILFAGATIMYNYGTEGILFGALLGLIHFPIDYITSRINKRLYKKGDIHNFFVSIGFDQLLHMITILLLGKVLL